MPPKKKKTALKKKQRASRALGFKKGRVNNKEIAYIRQWLNKKTYDQIAVELNRPVEVIAKYATEMTGLVTDNNKVTMDDAERIRCELYASAQWKFIKQQYSADELILFENMYIDLVSQFNSDILHTEQMQIFQAITLSVRIHRHNIKVYKMEEQLFFLTEIYDFEFSNYNKNTASKEDHDRIIQMETTVGELRDSIAAQTKDLTMLIDRQNDALKQLKGTREQRIKRLEESKQNFIGLMKLLQDEEMNKKVGTEILIHNKAAEKERDRLSSFHQYADGGVDLPIKNSDTVNKVEVESGDG